MTASTLTGRSGASLGARVFEGLGEIPEGLWEAAAPEEFFFRRAFLWSMEESGVEDATYRYVVLLSGERAVGAAVLSRFTLRLDLLTGDPRVRWLRRWSGRLLDVPVVCCGIPASFGQHHLHLADLRDLPGAVTLLDERMSAWAEETSTPLLAWKEWSPAQGVAAHASALGYVVLPTLPDHVVGPLPQTVEEHLGALRSAYRRKYRSALALVDAGGAHGGLRLVERDLSEYGVEAFHRGYRSVLERATVRLEAYPPAFFHRLASSGLGARTLTLAHEASGESMTALLLPSGRTLSFALIAKERQRYADSLYTVLLQCIVLHAIKRRFTWVRLGQTSGYAKCSVGARPRRLEVFLRMRGAVAHRLLERFGGNLFPETSTPALRVYKRQGSPQGRDSPEPKESRPHG